MDAADDSFPRLQGEELPDGSDMFELNYKLFQVIRTSPTLAKAHRNLDMLDVLWQAPFLVHRYPSGLQKTDLNDLKWWSHLKSTKGWEVQFCKNMDDPCKCRYMVACEAQNTVSGKFLRV
jgi:hypothetical protein